MVIYYGILQFVIFIRELLFVLFKPKLWQFYLYFVLEYMFFSPYYYVDKKAKNDQVFGFTPLFTMYRIIKKIKSMGLVYHESFLDLGCGDARLIFLMRLQFNYICTGIDSNKKLIHKAQLMQNALMLDQLDIGTGDFFECSWAEYGIIFLAWTTFKEKTLEKIESKLKEEVLEETIVVTLAFPIKDDDFELLASCDYLFSWGKSTVYIQKRVRLS